MTNWKVNGEYHRETGPAMEGANGANYWLQHGVFHRVDGPAYTNSTGDTMWFLNGKLHRIGGPAVTLSSGESTWYLNGWQYDSILAYCAALNIKDVEKTIFLLQCTNFDNKGTPVQIEITTCNPVIEKYQNLFDGLATTHAFENVGFAHTNDSETDYFGLLGAGILLSILCIGRDDLNNHTIKFANTVRQYQGHGCFRFLLEAAVKTLGDITCEVMDTANSLQTWSNLLDYPGAKIMFMESKAAALNKVQLLKKLQDNNSTEIFVSPRNFKINPFDEAAKLLEKCRTGSDRTYTGLWYGSPRSSDTNYFNP